MKNPFSPSHYIPALPPLRKGQCLNGWYYLADDQYWLLYDNNQHSGIIIAFLSHLRKVPHSTVHISDEKHSIGEAKTLTEAIILAGSNYIGGKITMSTTKEQNQC